MSNDFIKLWVTGLAFSFMCILYFILKLCGAQWAQGRPLWEAFLFLGIAILIIVAFCFRKKINGAILKRRMAKMAKEKAEEDAYEKASSESQN